MVLEKRSSGWNGGMSMRLFNKIVRNSNRRRNIISNSSSQVGKQTMSARHPCNSRSKSISKNSQETSSSFGLEDFQNLKIFGAQAGFSWRKEDGADGEINLGISQVSLAVRVVHSHDLSV